MREISTKKVKIGENVLIDGIEYVTEKYTDCRECDLYAYHKCHFIPCGNGMFKRVEKEPKHRPYKDTEEMIADWKERFMVSKMPAFCMPLIWIRHKSSNSPSLVNRFDINSVITYSGTWDMKNLFEDCTYLDGSPCGKVEE